MLPKPVKFGVERVGEIVADSRGATDRNSSLCERSAIEAEKTLPRSLTAKSAGLRESEFAEAKRTQEGNLFRNIRMSCRRQAVVELRADSGKRNPKLLNCKVTALCFGSAPQLIAERSRKPRQNWRWSDIISGLLRGSQGQNEIAGL